MSYRAANQTLKPEWIDHNGHLNMAYYVVLFDWGVDEVQEVFGLGVPYSDAIHPYTTFSAEFRARYQIGARGDYNVDCPFG